MSVPLSSDVILEILIRLTQYLRLRQLLKLHVWVLQDACWLLLNFPRHPVRTTVEERSKVKISVSRACDTFARCIALQGS
jgi:hypothetical protein